MCHLCIGVFLDSAVEIATFKYEEVVIRLQNAALGGNRARSVDVVPCHHADCYTSSLALADGLWHLTINTAISHHQHLNIIQHEDI